MSDRPARTGALAAEQRLSLPTVGMVLFLGSELMFFAGLFAAYFVLRSLAPPGQWPPPDLDLKEVDATAATVVLVISSVTLQAAVRRIRGGDRAGMRSWVAVSLVLGAAFLGAQFFAYATDNFSVSTGAYGSAFYTMTGFHALHVFAGLVLMAVVLGRYAAGAYSSEEHAGVEAVAYYWHFVDVVWLGLFATLYLIR